MTPIKPRILSIDPGKRETGLALVRFDGERFRLDKKATIRSKDGYDTPRKIALACLNSLLDVKSVGRLRVIVEFPASVYFGRSNTKALIETCRSAAEIARLFATHGYDVEFIDAGSVRSGGKVLTDKETKTWFKRIFGDIRTNTHVRDAAINAWDYLR